VCEAPASHWKPCTITLSEIGDVENGNRKKNPRRKKKRISDPTHSKGRHAACISITALRKTHLTNVRGTN